MQKPKKAPCTITLECRNSKYTIKDTTKDVTELVNELKKYGNLRECVPMGVITITATGRQRSAAERMIDKLMFGD